MQKWALFFTNGSTVLFGLLVGSIVQWGRLLLFLPDSGTKLSLQKGILVIACHLELLNAFWVLASSNTVELLMRSNLGLSHISRFFCWPDDKGSELILWTFCLWHEMFMSYVMYLSVLNLEVLLIHWFQSGKKEGVDVLFLLVNEPQNEIPLNFDLCITTDSEICSWSVIIPSLLFHRACLELDDFYVFMLCFAGSFFFFWLRMKFVGYGNIVIHTVDLHVRLRIRVLNLLWLYLIFQGFM